jgi:hypothetical protein
VAAIFAPEALEFPSLRPDFRLQSVGQKPGGSAEALPHSASVVVEPLADSQRTSNTKAGACLLGFFTL